MDLEALHLAVIVGASISKNVNEISLSICNYIHQIEGYIEPVISSRKTPAMPLKYHQIQFIISLKLLKRFHYS